MGKGRNKRRTGHFGIVSEAQKGSIMSKYDIYLYENSTVLKNLLGITDEKELDFFDLYDIILVTNGA